MIQNCKICGVKDPQTLSYIINHKYPPKMIGFICNWPKSKRFVKNEDLNQLLNIDKKQSKFVAVLVNPDEIILEQLKVRRRVDFYLNPHSHIFLMPLFFQFLPTISCLMKLFFFLNLFLQ